VVTSEPDELVQIGHMLKAARKTLGYTQKGVADKAGISRLRYHDIEAGRSAARITTLISIARALGLELMFVPQVWVPAVNALLDPQDIIDDGSAFTFISDEDASS
jgi:DNA-binding XRE family transcriptional regulator